MSNTTERRAPNVRRIVRTQRLLADLGYADVLDALEDLRRLRASLPPLSQAQIATVARVLADRSADIGGVDHEDNWRLYGEDFKKDAIACAAALGHGVQA